MLYNFAAFMRTCAVALINIMELLLFARAIISWFPLDSSNPIISFIHITTEPILIPIRNLLNRISALRSFPMDFSIIIAFLLLQVISVFFN